jgi:ribose transport system permease protein
MTSSGQRMGDSIRVSLRGVSYAWAAIVVFLVLLLVNAIANTNLVAPKNWAATFASMAPFIIVAMAQVPAVMSGNGGLDLSVGPVSALVSSIVVVKLQPHGLSSPFVVVPVALGVGLAVGLINGILVAYARIPAIVTTLGTYLIFGALALEILPNPGGTAPRWLADLANGAIGPIPGLAFVLLGCGLAWALLQRTAFRRNLLAVGGDARAAFTAGVDVARVRVIAFAITGLLAAVAGLVFVSVLNAGDASVGPQFTIVSLAGVALGGVTLAGGRGGMLGAAAGGATLFLLQSVLDALGVSVFYTGIAFGVALLLAIAVNSWADMRRKRIAAGASVASTTTRLDSSARAT